MSKERREKSCGPKQVSLGREEGWINGRKLNNSERWKEDFTVVDDYDNINYL